MGRAGLFPRQVAGAARSPRITMSTLLLVFFALCLVVILVGLVVPRARLAVIAAGSVLLYLPSLFAWYFLIYFQYVDFGRLIAPYRWTQHGRAVASLWFFGPPLVPSLILLLFSVGKYMYRRRRQA
jgi:phosphate starvation-inducible membrane PsiE